MMTLSRPLPILWQGQIWSLRLLKGKSWKSAFLVAIVLFDTIMHDNLTPVEFLRLRSFGGLDQRSPISCLSTFSKGFSSETTGPISLQFHMQPPSKGQKKVYIFGLGHMTKIVTMPICVKKI